MVYDARHGRIGFRTNRSTDNNDRYADARCTGARQRQPTAIYCLEDYLTLLKQYPYSGQHLRFKADNGITYEIYYVPASTGKELTEIPVPQDSTYTYEISGDNDSGFIVTVTLG